MQDHGIGLRRIGPGHDGPPAALVAASWLAGRAAVIRRESPVGKAGRVPRPDRREPPRADGPALPDLERALLNPAAVFDAPGAVLAHPRLLRACKREILRRWAWDEYLKDVAAAEGMAEGEPSRLDAVKAALLALDETWRPDPAAPAAAVPGPPPADPEDADPAAPRRAAA